MAKVTETTVIPEPVVPPRTFTVELNEEEFDTLFVVLATTVPYNVSKFVEEIVVSPSYKGYDVEVADAANRLSMKGNKNLTHGLYDTFQAAFNG